MVAAMMLPLILHRVWVTAISSLWTRRHRAVAGFLGGFFAAWLPLGLIAAALLQATWTRTYAAPALAFAAAALWQRTPAYRRALMACNRTRPLAPVGWRANWDCFRFGGMIGAAYVRTCWFLMLACTFADHGPVAMAGGMAVSIVEHRSLRPALIQQATFVLAGYYGVLAVLGR